MLEYKTDSGELDTTFLTEEIGATGVTYQEFFQLYTDTMNAEAVGKELGDKLDESGKDINDLLQGLIDKIKTFDDSKIMNKAIQADLKEAQGHMKMVSGRSDFADYIGNINVGLRLFKKVLDSVEPKTVQQDELSQPEAAPQAEIIGEEQLEASVQTKDQLKTNIADTFRDFKTEFYKTVNDPLNTEPGLGNQLQLSYLESSILRLPLQDVDASKLPGIIDALQSTFGSTTLATSESYTKLIDNLTKLNSLYNS